MGAVSHYGDRCGAVDVRALLVFSDPITIQRVSHILKEFSISPDTCQEMSETVGRVNRQKFDAVQHATHTQSAQRGIDLDRRTFPSVIVHDGQHTNHLPRAHSITHEIHRPAFARLARRGLHYGASEIA